MQVSLRRVCAGATVSSLALLGLSASPAPAVNADHGDRIVSATPAAFTPHVMNGSVNAITQVGNKIIVAGTFTKVSPAGDVLQHGRRPRPQPDLRLRRHHRRDRHRVQPQPRRQGELAGPRTAPTSTSAGSFSSVGGNTAIKRVVKLTTAGAVVPAFKSVPNKVVNDVVVRGSRVYLGGAFTSVKSGTVTVGPGRPRRRRRDHRRRPGVGQRPVHRRLRPRQQRRRDHQHHAVRRHRGRLPARGGRQLLDRRRPAARPGRRARHQRRHRHGRSVGDQPVRPGPQQLCAGVFDTFTRDVDFSPDGYYFVVSATGAFAGGAGAGTCATPSAGGRPTSTGNDPTWSDYTGGDTTYGVAVTGSAVYVGGHMRWENNPFQGDQAGPGAVPREGIAALDPVNGLPLSWNPGRTRGVGAQALFATDQGLWVGSDTDQDRRGDPRPARLHAASRRHHGPDRARRPRSRRTSSWPSAADRCGRQRALPRERRRPALQAADGGPDWTARTGLVSGGNIADWGSTVPVDSTVPARTPAGRSSPPSATARRTGTSRSRPGRTSRCGSTSPTSTTARPSPASASSTCSSTATPCCPTSTSSPPRATRPAPCATSRSPPTATASTSTSARSPRTR